MALLHWAGPPRRLAAVAVTVAAAVLAVAGTVLPARADGPSLVANSGGYIGIAPSADIAVEGPNHSLLFYWQTDGTPTWNAETVAGPGTTYSEPAMTVNVGTVEITVMGPNHSLMVYSQVNGTTPWTAQTVAGPGTTYSKPSIAVVSTSTDIAVEGRNGSLMAYSEYNGSTYWSPETVESSGCCEYGPSITAVPDDLDVYIAWTGAGSSQLIAAWTTLESFVSPTPTWNFYYSAIYWVSPPTIVATGDTVFVSYTDGQGRIELAQSADESNTWNFGTVAGPGTSATAAPVAIGDGAIVVAVTGAQGQLLFYWAPIGTLSFNAETVAGAGSTVSDPSLTLNENSVNISAIGAGGYLDFYWQIDGQSTWHPEGVTTGTGLPLP